jgi:MoaA/NifB/PqqE/SkfB family radical SAM enzyme
MNPSNTYCVMPHVGMAIQNDSDFCCCNVNKESWKNGKHEVMFAYKHQLKDSFKSYTRKIIAASLDKGIKHSSCQYCWDLEQAGQSSPRLYLNEKFQNLIPILNQPQVLIIKPGNTCNFACRMCNPATSTSWYQDSYELTDKKITFQEYITQFETIRDSFDKDKSLWGQLQDWIHQIKYIDIYGGEPFLNQGIFNLLEYAVNENLSQDINLQIHTNCSIYNQKYLDILSQFKNVNLMISFDSHQYNELMYIRHKINPEQAFSNAHRIINFFSTNKNVSLACTCTITHYNVYNIDEIIDNLEQMLKIPVHENIVTTHEFDIRHLPGPVKELLLQKLKNKTIKNFLEQTIPGCDIYWPKFCKTTDKLDLIRNQQFKNIFPIWWKILEPYWIN